MRKRRKSAHRFTADGRNTRRGWVSSLLDLESASVSKSIVIYDTEFTAWAGSADRNWSQPWEHREVIQIGAVKVQLDSRPIIQESFNIIVRPAINCRLSQYIIDLTGITQTQVDQEGVDLCDAIDEFHDFCGQGSLPVFSYGDDFEVLLENSRLYGNTLPLFTGGAFDIHPLFQSAGIDTSSYSSGTLHRAFGISFDGRPHDALQDATSIALSVETLLELGALTAHAELKKSAA